MQHQLQPIFDNVAEINCTLRKILNSQNKPTDGNVAVTVEFEKTDMATPLTMTIPAAKAMLLRPKNVKRLSIGVVNLSALNNVFIGTSKSVTSLAGSNPGYPILPSSSVDDDEYTGELWAYADVQLTVAVWENVKP